MIVYSVNFDTAIPDMVWDIIEFETQVAMAAKKKRFATVYDETHTCEYIFDDNWQLQKVN